MFKKHAVTVATSTPLKSSAARAFRLRLQQQFAQLHNDAQLQLLVPAREVLHLDKLSQPKAHLYSINRQQPLFCDSSCGKSSNSSKQQNQHQSDDDACALFPTVYALWLLPQLLPRLIVHAPVSEKLCGGADLFAPGVIRIETTTVVRRGSLVAVCVSGNDAPFAVGQLLVDPAMFLNPSSREGKAVKVLHCCGDELWLGGDKSTPNSGFGAQQVDACPDWQPSEIPSPVAQENQQQQPQQQSHQQLQQLQQQQPQPPQKQSYSSLVSASRPQSSAATPLPAAATPAAQQSVFDGLGSQIEACQIDDAPQSWDESEPQLPDSDQDQPHTVTDTSAAAEASQQTDTAAATTHHSPPLADDANAPQSDESAAAPDAFHKQYQPAVDTATMDAALEFALVFALKHSISDDMLPLPPSQFFDHMKAVHVSDDGWRLDVHQSSHKKLAKFLKHYSQYGLIHLRYMGSSCKNACIKEDCCVGVNRTHPLYISTPITPERLAAIKAQRAAEAQTAALALAESSNNQSSASDYAPKHIALAFMPDAALMQSDIFAHLSLPSQSKRPLFTSAEIKQHLNAYTASHQLDASQGRVKLDQTLKFTLLPHDSSAEGSLVTRVNLIKAIEQRCVLHHAIMTKGIASDQARFAKGGAPSVTISLVALQGRKMATHATGLEAFGLVVPELVSAASKRFAASCSAPELTALKNRAAQHDLVIQGSVQQDLAQWLQSHCGIPQQCITIVAPKKKGGGGSGRR